MTIRRILGRIGPAFVVGACIIGPGSVTLMSKTGAAYGYDMLWVAVLAGALMCGYIALFMRFGILSSETFLGVARRKIGAWFAVLCGVTLASTDAAFQFGNCLGVATGMEVLFPGMPRAVWPTAFTVAAILFLFSLRNIYAALERVMAFFLVLMLGAFLVNLIAAGPDVRAAVRGAVIPTIPADVDWIIIGGLVGTTFCLVAVVFQAYVVKARGWRESDMRSGIIDTLTASVIVTLLGVIMMMTAAAVLHPKGITIGDARDMAMQLQLLLGPAGKIIFGIGLSAAAFSSFVTNSLIGGTLLNDGLGLGGKVNSIWTKLFATCVLLTGLATSLVIIAKGEGGPDTADPKVIAIAVGQAATMLAVPLGAIACVVVLFDRRAVGGRPLPLWARGVVLVGAAVLLVFAAVMYVKIQPVGKGLLGG